MRSIILFLLVGLTFTGCASIAGSSNTKSHILYEHRVPMMKTALLKNRQGFIGSLINGDNLEGVGSSVAEVVGSVSGVVGFPYSVIPAIVKAGMKGGVGYKEETSDQEVSKLYYTEGMKNIEAKMSDGTKIKSEWLNYESEMSDGFIRLGEKRGALWQK